MITMHIIMMEQATTRSFDMFVVSPNINLSDLDLCLFPGFETALCPVDMAFGEVDLQSMSAVCKVMPETKRHTMYCLKSSSFSLWKRFRSFNTPELASLTSFSDTSSACSSWIWSAQFQT